MKATIYSADGSEVVFSSAPTVITFHELLRLQKSDPPGVGTFVCRRCGRTALMRAEAGDGLRLAFEVAEFKADGVLSPQKLEHSITPLCWRKPRTHYLVACYAPDVSLRLRKFVPARKELP